MTVHVKFHEDSDGDIVDVDWYCSELCYNDAGHTEVGAYPCGEESDSCVTCAQCGTPIHHGLQEPPHVHETVNGISTVVYADAMK